MNETVCRIRRTLAAGFLPRWVTALLGVGCGLFVAELVRNRRLTLEAQERLRTLVETSPAAIVTVDERGFIELANQAASELMAPRDGKLVGNPISAFLPDLHHALRWEEPKLASIIADVTEETAVDAIWVARWGNPSRT